MTTVTIKDVAQRAGVSPKTVSRVINGESHVRAEVRDTVRRVVAELDYRPNAFARSLSSSRSYLLGLLIDDPTSGYAADVQLGALMRCRDCSYHLVVEPLDVAAEGWREQVAGSIAALRLDGAILTPPLCDNIALLEVLASAKLPYVLISPRGDIDDVGVVRMDDRAAAFAMTAYLLRLGHRRIGFIMGDPRHSVSLLRYEGFRSAMSAAAAEVDDNLVVEGDFALRSGIELGEVLLRMRSPPSAIFASNDDMAIGVLMTAMKLGLHVPDQLSIAGFDDAPIARAVWPQLTTIRQPKAEMAAAAVDILVDPNYRTSPGSARYKRLLDYDLIARMSTIQAPRP